VEKQADPEHELMQPRRARAWSKPQTVGSGRVPFWALSSCEAKEWVRHQAQAIRPTSALGKDPGPPGSK
jgi:hypothetical protein